MRTMSNGTTEQERRSTTMTVSELVQTARADHVGSSSVSVRDRGATTTEADDDGTEREVRVRDFDLITVAVSGYGRRETLIHIERSDVSDPWRYDIEMPTSGKKPSGYDRPAVPLSGVLAGVGDVVRLVHAVRDAMHLGRPRGTSHPTQLRAFTEGR